MALSFTWLGHSTFLFTSPTGKKILIEPWVQSNPACPDAAKKLPPLDLILITHGHSDHAGDAVSIARSSGAHVVANYEICLWLESKGIQNTAPMGIGGTQKIGDIAITMVNAIHTSSIVENGVTIPLGNPAGYVIRFEDGTTIYFAGDTDVYGDMRLIAEVHRPTIAFLPMGDRFTMGPIGASRAVDFLGVKQVVPMHYATFPFLTGTVQQLRELVEPKLVQVLELKPGETAS